MNVRLISKSVVTGVNRYLVEPLLNGELLINNDNQLAIVDYGFNVLKSCELDSYFFMDHHYLSDDRKYFLWCFSDLDESYFCFLDLTQPVLKPLKYDLQKGVCLYPYYTWDNDRFIIAGDKDIYFSYEVKSGKFKSLDSWVVDPKYPRFKEIIYYSDYYRVIYHDLKKEIVVYRRGEEEGNLNIIYVTHPIDEMNVNFEIYQKDCCEYIHDASFLDGILVLVHEDTIFFYYLDKEFHRIRHNKVLWSFAWIDLFKVDDDIYCIFSSFYLNNPKDNVIEIYKIER